MAQPKMDAGLIEENHRYIAAYDNAPLLAKQHFGDVMGSPVAVQARLGEKREAGVPDIELVVAYNYARVKSLIDSGLEERARETVNRVVIGNNGLGVLNAMLCQLDAPYVDTCIEQGSLLSQGELDDVLFERFAPKSIDLSRTYHDRGHLACVRSRAENSFVVSLYSSLAGRKTGKSPELVLGSLIGGLSVLGPYGFTGTFDQLWTFVEDTLGCGPEDYSLVQTQDGRFINYLAAIFHIKKTASIVQQEFPTRPIEIGAVEDT